MRIRETFFTSVTTSTRNIFHIRDNMKQVVVRSVLDSTSNVNLYIQNNSLTVTTFAHIHTEVLPLCSLDDKLSVQITQNHKWMH